MIELQMILSLFHGEDINSFSSVGVEVDGEYVGDFSVDTITEDLAYKLLSGIRISEGKVTLEVY